MKDSPKNIGEWARTVANYYPEITDIVLTGSRSVGHDTPKSDYDIVICLSESCYAPDDSGIVTQVDFIEQRISFDKRVRFDALDLFWLRPDGEIGRWTWPHGGDISGTPRDTELGMMELYGVVLGDFDRLRRDLGSAILLYRGQDNKYRKQEVTQ